MRKGTSVYMLQCVQAGRLTKSYFDGLKKTNIHGARRVSLKDLQKFINVAKTVYPRSHFRVVKVTARTYGFTVKMCQFI